MKQIPFYANDAKDMRCMVAVLRMIIEYWTHQKSTWREMAALTGFRNNIAAWTVTAWTRLARQGFDIRMIEKFDYAAYGEQGRAYLENYFEPDALDWVSKHSNLAELQSYIPEFLQTVRQEKRSPTLADIDALLAANYLVFVTLNSQVLNDRTGFVSHAILVYGKAGDTYIAHDPGLAPQPDRHIPADKLWDAMGGNDNTNEVTGVRLRK